MYFLPKTMQEISHSGEMQFFLALAREGWEFDFYNYGAKLEKKDFSYFVNFRNGDCPEITIYKDGQAIAGGAVCEFFALGLQAIKKAMREIKKIAINAISNNELFFITHNFY